MIVHGSSLSPFVRKVMVFAHEKGLDFETKVAGPGRKSEEFLAISPFGKIPAFEDGDYKLCDSSAIVHYLDAQYPAKRLIPTEPRALGKAVWFDEYADTIMFAAVAPIFFNLIVASLIGMTSDVAAVDKAQAEALPPLMTYLEGVIPPSGFLVEDRFTLADIAVVAPLVNLDHAGVSIDGANYPKVAAYATRILARPSFVTMVNKDRKFLTSIGKNSEK